MGNEPQEAEDKEPRHQQHCGSANPRSFSRGKRGIAGSLLFALFDRDPLWMILRGRNNDAQDKSHWYYAHEQEQLAIDGNQSIWDWSATPTNTVNTELRPPEFLDQVMPMDITLVAQNELN